MLKYFDLDNEWHTLDLMAVRSIHPEGMGNMAIRMKDGGVIIARYMESC